MYNRALYIKTLIPPTQEPIFTPSGMISPQRECLFQKCFVQIQVNTNAFYFPPFTQMVTYYTHTNLCFFYSKYLMVIFL